nr:60S ribosomal protein L17 [Seculamonas ecuadoriensis]
MVRYSQQLDRKGNPAGDDPSKVVKTRGSHLRCHFKNTRETAMAIRGLTLKRAEEYLRNVLEHKEAIPFRRFRGGIGRSAQAKVHGTSQCRWPTKSVQNVLDLLQNARANAESNPKVAGVNADALVVKHVQVNQAPHRRRRTYRAHGRINAFVGSPCHIELKLVAQPDVVKKAPAAEGSKKKKTVSVQ